MAESNPFQRLIKSASNIEPHEQRAVMLSFAFVFMLMAGYYILRPVRDAMASDWTDTELSILWNINFIASIAVVALYGFAVTHIRFQILVPIVYAFFAATFVFFYFISGNFTDAALLDKTFFVWVSVFSLFHISVFWSFMSDLYTKEQSKRLFAVIAVGASAGALVGPLIPTLFAGVLGIELLMLVAAALLCLPIPIIILLERLKSTDLHNEDVHADVNEIRIGGNPFAGFKMFFTNRYLLAIGLFMLLYTTVGSFVYFEQKNLLEPFERATRTQILGGVDLTINILTFAIGFFATSRIVSRFGMPTTLALVPFFVCLGLVILAFAPIVTVVLALQVGRRAGNFAVTRPGREMLYTVVNRETRFKAKPVLDIVVYRGGDAFSSIIFASLTDGLGLALGAMAAIGAGIAAAWVVVGRFLGLRFERTKGGDDEEISPRFQTPAEHQ